jgi:hypothetical protein
MEDPQTSRTPGNQPSKKVEPSTKVKLPEEVEQHMRMAARMLYDMIVDYRKRHPEKVKPPDEPADATKTDISP